MDSMTTTIQRRSTGVVYDLYMARHHCIWDPNYPECPNRLTEVLKRCEEMNLLDRCHKLHSREATREELLLKHSPEIVNLLQQCEEKLETELEEICSRFDSIYISQETFRASLLAAGSTLNLIDAICDNQVLNGMAIVRPPGHHAMKSEYCGYCFFNNVALAADYALKRYNLSRILIVDWDVHHGQATQQMFYEDPRVVYFSIHRYDHGTFWPNLRESECDFIGEGAGKGYNFNIPLNKRNCGNADYLAIFHQILLPVAVEFEPQLIIISAGYDAALGCPEFNPELVLVSAGFDSALGDDKGEMKVTPACYAHFINALSCFSNEKIGVVLEGGYFCKSLAEGAALTLRALLGDPCPDIGPVEEIQESVRESILNVIYTHRHFWKCFKSYDTHLPHLPPPEPLSFLHSVKFLHEAPVCNTFPTRDCYPVSSKEKRASDTAILNQLIRDTKLRMPQFKSYLISPASREYEKEIVAAFENFSGKIVKINQSKISKQDIQNAMNSLLNDDTDAIIFDSLTFCGDEDHADDEHLLMNYIFGELQAKRTMFINFCSDIYIPEIFSNEDNFLHFSFHKTSSSPLFEDQKNFIQFAWNTETGENFIEAWLKVILPIGYQFNPTVVVVFINFSEKKQLSSELYGYLIRWTMALANGKIILVTKYDSGNELETAAFLTSCKALLRSPLPTLKNVKTMSYETTNILKNINFKLKDKWKNLNFCVKFLNQE